MKKILWDDRHELPMLVRSLQQGHVLAGSSDTVLGLLAAVNPEGFARLNTIKGRTQKPYVVLIGDKSKVNIFAQTPLASTVQRLVDQCWPGPLTIVLKAKAGLPAHLQSADGTIALRVPQHAGLLAILAHCDGLFSTSANKAGEPVALTIDELDKDILQAIEYLIVERDAQVRTAPSTIIDCSTASVRIVRPGAYSPEQLEKIIS